MTMFALKRGAVVAVLLTAACGGGAQSRGTVPEATPVPVATAPATPAPAPAPPAATEPAPGSTAPAAPTVPAADPATEPPFEGGFGMGPPETPGRGSGTGMGSGRGRTAEVPTVSFGQPSVRGDLDEAIIRRYIKRNAPKIQKCYARELRAKPSLSGIMMTNFLIDPKGIVIHSTGSGVDLNVASCVAAVIKNIAFPKPKGGGLVQVKYPFIFRLVGGG